MINATDRLMIWYKSSLCTTNGDTECIRYLYIPYVLENGAVVVRDSGMGGLVTKPFHSDDVITLANPPIRAALEKSHVVGSRGWVTQGDVTQSRKGWRL